MSDGHGDVVLDGTWMCSGWQSVLPQQATALHMLVATATDRDLDGSLDTLVDELGYAWFDYLTDGLDCAVRWTHPLDLPDQIEVDAGEQARRECLAAFSLAGIVQPGIRVALDHRRRPQSRPGDRADASTGPRSPSRR